MMKAVAIYVVHVAIFRNKIVHELYASGFIIVRTEMHHLYTQTFVYSFKFCERAIKFFLFRCCFYSPIKIFLRYKIWQANCRNPIERRLVGVINTIDSVLPPETFQRRNDIFKEAFNFIVRLVTHFKSVCNRIKYIQRTLISTTFFIRVALAANSNKVRFRHRDDFRFVLRQIKFLEFFFKIKWHIFSFLIHRLPHHLRFLAMTFFTYVHKLVINIGLASSAFLKPQCS